jgi:hypothetical protein
MTNLACQHRTRDIAQTNISRIWQFQIERASENEGQEMCLRPVRHCAWNLVKSVYNVAPVVALIADFFETKERGWT